MALAFSVLGSGSSGNSTLVRLNGCAQPRHLLIDAGLTPRATAKRLAAFGLSLADLSDILLTHLDNDHCCPTWLKAAKRHNITLHLHRRQRTRAMRERWTFEHVSLFDEEVELRSGEEVADSSTPSTIIKSVPFAHDQLGTVGFIIEHDGARLGFATDLGRVPPGLFDQFFDLDALALESNYDRRMQLASGRPVALKRRIMGGSGHLSNDEALDAVLRIAEQCDLQRIVLLHLSRQCNCPDLLSALYAQRAPHLAPLVTITNQFVATPLLEITAPAQRSPRRPPRQVEVQTLLPFFARHVERETSR